MKEVNKMTISQGIEYTGEVINNGYNDVPHGIGICKYSDHEERGRFKNGFLDGTAYINYHDWMCVGLAKNGVINGWGIKASKGEFTFGIFDDNILKVNLTPLVDIFWHKILEDAKMLRQSPVKLLKNGEIFVGVSQYSDKGKFGFHFLDNGEVFLGVCDFSHKNRTGKFLHFDLDYNITRGEYKDGLLIREIDCLELIHSCEVWVTHAYLDFDINMNYSPKSFLLDEKKLMHISQIGNTVNNLFVKAFTYTIEGSRCSCDTSDDKKAIWFSFPADRDDINECLNSMINQEGEPWAPKFSDYRVEFINNLGAVDTRHLVVYSHISNWDKEASFDLDIYYETDLSEFGYEEDNTYDNESYDRNLMQQLIPDFWIKEEQLSEQWKNGGWYYTYPSLRDYVKSLAYEDDVPNFFGWLFNDARLNNCDIWSLPYEYEIAFEQFLNLFFDLDEM